MLDVIIIKVSFVIDITAGIESTTKIISDDSIKSKVKNSEVT